MILIGCPAQLIVQSHHKVFLGVNRLSQNSLDQRWSQSWSGLPKVNDRFLGFCGVELQMVPTTPDSKVPHQVPVILLSGFPDSPTDGRVISKPLDVTQLLSYDSVRSVQAEEKWAKHCALGDSSAAEYGVRCDVFCLTHCGLSGGRLYVYCLNKLK